MPPQLIAGLRARAPQIKARWQRLLGSVHATRPPVAPAALGFMIDWTFDEIVRELGHPHASAAPVATRCLSSGPDCNPFDRYLAAGRAAFAKSIGFVPPVDAARVHEAIERAFAIVRHRELSRYCRVCPRRNSVLAA